MNIKIAHHPIKSIVFATLIVGIAALVGWQLTKNTSHAADIRNFDPGNIMSDIVMSNKDTMSVQDIQNFLNSKNYCDNKDTYKAAWYPHLEYNIKDGRFVCMARDSFDGQSAAQIIWQVAQDYSINPQFLLVLLEKEQGLVSDTWPNSRQYQTATGFGCPDTAACDTKYFGLKNQLQHAASLFRTVLNGGWSNYPIGQTYVQYHPDASCGGSVINIQNRATSALYRYTPYQPNRSALEAGYGTGDSCGAYGNRNTWRLFTDWFGVSTGALYGGVDYAKVFDASFYLNKYPDLKAAFNDNIHAAFDHFIHNGINEGRQAISNFDVISYRNQNPDLRLALGDNLTAYYKHYIMYGYKENRVSFGNQEMVTVTSYKGRDYSLVYSFDSYLNNNNDIKIKFKNDEFSAIAHFVNFGMKEGRLASDSFDVNSYRIGYRDLRIAFGDNLPLYYIHYLESGKPEGRTAINNIASGVTVRDGTNYKDVYSFDFYRNRYGDVKNAFGFNDEATLRHFIDYGMKEGRQASDSFDIISYRNRYGDLRNAFGDNLNRYYSHYINYGRKEGRIAVN